jgi:hypothetical protein
MDPVSVWPNAGARKRVMRRKNAQICAPGAGHALRGCELEVVTVRISLFEAWALGSQAGKREKVNRSFTGNVVDVAVVIAGAWQDVKEI